MDDKKNNNGEASLNEEPMVEISSRQLSTFTKKVNSGENNNAQSLFDTTVKTTPPVDTNIKNKEE